MIPYFSTFGLPLFCHKRTFPLLPLNYPFLANAIGHAQGRSSILGQISASIFFNSDKNLLFQAFGHW